MRVSLSVLVLLVTACLPSTGADCYVSAKRNDLAAGGKSTPWRSVYRSDRVTIRFCVSHHNRSTAKDGGMTNSVLEYNYSHSNFGSGYLICQYRDAGLFENNIVRYNISQDGGLFDHNAGIHVWVGGAEMKSALIHNNTIFNSKGSAVIIAGDKEFANQMPVLTFYSNIFVTQGPQVVGAQHGKFAGRFADPMLRKDGNGPLTDPNRLNELREYQLLPDSPAIGAGFDLRSIYSIDPGKRDYFGNLLPVSGPVSIGAHEAAARR